ncbi:MAG: hypothetical protein J6R18_06480 [Kiritimatiellae bacterium]|nr:hypothetical protein [Kiritimatiellia bacterium]
MKTFIAYIFSVFSVFVGGCYNLQVATNESLCNSAIEKGKNEPVEHVLISNYGWYLFNYIPMVCGNTVADDVLPWSFFSNHVDPVLLHGKMIAYASSKNANVSNLSISRTEKVFFEFPGSQIPVPIPFLISFQEVQVSGVLTKRDASVDTKGKEAVK